MAEYNHSKIEKKWQKEWEKKGIYHAKSPSLKATADQRKPKYYSLIEFPYPSGDGLHVGHPRPYIGMDIISRKRRLEGYNVLYPIGWDAFGLPTENYAIKTGKDPRVVTKKNSDTFRRQIQSLGISFDWSREVNTTDPKYYKWTQWIFLQFLKKGLAYKKKMMINWCPKDKIGLANEEVVDGKCERCGTPVEQREKEQWMLAITKYADRLFKDLDDVDYLPQIKLGQRNWIGRSEGVEIEFKVNSDVQRPNFVKVFTTRPETIFGATFLVMAGDKDKFTGKYVTNPATKEKIPVWEAEYVMKDYGTGAIMAVPAHDERDYEFAKKHNLPIRYVIAQQEKEVVDPPKEGKPFIYRKAVECYIRNPKDNTFLILEWKKAKWRTGITGGVEEGEDMVRAARREILEETGYKNLKFIQYLGAPLRVEFYHPGKNENRRADFYGLYFELENTEQEEVTKEEKEKHSMVWVLGEKVKSFITTSQITFGNIGKTNLSYEGQGILINSGKFNDLDSEQAKKEIIKFVGGKEKVSFKLRDWVFSRQRYWGEPIPVINCPKCGLVPVPDKDLPVKLPKVKNYQPTDSGESPLANIAKWVKVKCPNCKGEAKRETDTMPNWAGSSWYYLAYCMNEKAFTGKAGIENWKLQIENFRHFMPVDWYNGGNEHTTLHLLYSRFWHKFLFDLKLVPTHEPYMKRTSHGLILAEGGEKMSKSRGNVINPDDIVKTYGADTLRVYEMFMGPFDQAAVWSMESIIGSRRFIEKVWRIGNKIVSSEDLDSQVPIPFLDKTIKKVSEDVEAMRFNTAISSMMICANHIESAIARGLNIRMEDYKKFLKILSPFAPHITEELWTIFGEKKSINLSDWPQFDPKMIIDEEVKIIIQVNGKLRGEMMVRLDESEEAIKNKALKDKFVAKYAGGGTPKKVIYVKNRLINIVV